MPVVSIPCALLEPRLAALAQYLPEALDGRVKGVHQGRVASRRLREVLPVVGRPAGERRLRRALRRVRKVTQVLGPVRELDVSLELLEELRGSHRDLAPATRVVRALVEEERERRRDRMLATLHCDQVQRTLDAVEAVIARLRKQDDAGDWRPLLATRARERADRLAAAVADAGLLFDPVRLHDVRIAAKKLRYALEIAGEARIGPTARLVGVLKDSQDRLGRLHDLQVLLVFVRAPALAVVSGYRAPLCALRDHVERECHREHARYLRRRSRLLTVCDAVEPLVDARPVPVTRAEGAARPTGA